MRRALYFRRAPFPSYLLLRGSSSSSLASPWPPPRASITTPRKVFPLPLVQISPEPLRRSSISLPFPCSLDSCLALAKDFLRNYSDTLGDPKYLDILVTSVSFFLLLGLDCRSLNFVPLPVACSKMWPTVKCVRSISTSRTFIL